METVAGGRGRGANSLAVAGMDALHLARDSVRRLLFVLELAGLANSSVHCPGVARVAVAESTGPARPLHVRFPSSRRRRFQPVPGSVPAHGMGDYQGASMARDRTRCVENAV